jgi:hypothetical protein
VAGGDDTTTYVDYVYNAARAFNHAEKFLNFVFRTVAMETDAMDTWLVALVHAT